PRNLILYGYPQASPVGADEAGFRDPAFVCFAAHSGGELFFNSIPRVHSSKKKQRTSTRFPQPVEIRLFYLSILRNRRSIRLTRVAVAARVMTAVIQSSIVAREVNS